MDVDYFLRRIPTNSNEPIVSPINPVGSGTIVSESEVNDGAVHSLVPMIVIKPFDPSAVKTPSVVAFETRLPDKRWKRKSGVICPGMTGLCLLVYGSSRSRLRTPERSGTKVTEKPIATVSIADRSTDAKLPGVIQFSGAYHPDSMLPSVLCIQTQVASPLTVTTSNIKTTLATSVMVPPNPEDILAGDVSRKSGN